MIREFLGGAAVLALAFMVVSVATDDTPPPTPAPQEPREPGDVDLVYELGEAAMRTGMVTEYEVSGWGGTLDLTLSSLLPGDARAVADGVCEASRQQLADHRWTRAWKVRVFILTSGDRPAAVCQL